MTSLAGSSASDHCGPVSDVYLQEGSIPLDRQRADPGPALFDLLHQYVCHLKGESFPVYFQWVQDFFIIFTCAVLY